jgi:hypothetical protein
MSRAYTLDAANVTLANNSPVSIAFLQVPTAAPIVVVEFLRAYCSQSNSNSGVQQRIQIATQVTTFPTLTSQAPQPVWASDPASKIGGGTAGAAGTSGINASAEGSGAKTVLVADAFNTLNGWLWVPTPYETIVESAQSTAHGIAVSLPAAPGTLSAWNGGFTFRELG